jgi:hypothetical protein
MDFTCTPGLQAKIAVGEMARWLYIESGAH